MADVIDARILPTRTVLVARRHIDFKRVCTCCCLPCCA
ncbi:Ms4527A family Cys-rich leader peptide [Mycobacterium sp. pV006]